jgi:WD repeat-containing protein 81
MDGCVPPQVVRAVFEPNEYPSSMERLYQWTPDECLPDFYDESEGNHVFESLHQGMADLRPPAWAASPADFLKRYSTSQ